MTSASSMVPLALHPFHQARGAFFFELNGWQAVASYGSPENEYLSLTSKCACLDLSFRSRLCLLGADREKFLHGQVTNDILRCPPGHGTYAALVTAKGKLQCDLYIYKLPEELLLDFEPGLSPSITSRLEKYVIAEDVQIIDVAPHYGLLSVQGPTSLDALKATNVTTIIPNSPLEWAKTSSASGDLYTVNNPRLASSGFDLFVPIADLEAVAEKLSGHMPLAGMNAFEIARIENGIPRFGADMDESNLAPEALGENAISYAKGCYIGQEVIARIRTYGQVAKSLCLIRLPAELPKLPASQTPLFKEGKGVGYITSSTLSPRLGAPVALAYVRKEAHEPGQSLNVGAADGGMAQVIGHATKLR